MKFLYRVYQLFIAAPVIVISTIITSLTIAIGASLGSAHFWGYWPGRYWSKVVCRILLLPVHVEVDPAIRKDKSYVFVANHQGSMDIFLIYGYIGRNFKWMMKKSLRKMPFIGLACEKARHIFVDKSGPKAIEATYRQARETLQGGTSLVVFPEGARTFDGKMIPFRRGAYALAQEIGLEIVPITIKGCFEVLPRTKGFSFVEWHPLHLIMHAPIPSNDINKAMEQSREIIEKDL
ncbi:MAG: 1-acyl-sn-glycerol-3-phosphate acyltransferase [Bacteroidaceae bacterium]|nr:1-acyl-sn-glycerol-3-phosphate acyltransferase [Bacteroidaceae bacterium]